MSGPPSIVVDTNVLLNLATPIVDTRQKAPSGEDPLKVLLTVYDVHIPDVILSELYKISDGEDLLATASDLVLKTTDYLTTHNINYEDRLTLSSLDKGEICCILLANNLKADMFITDEFNSINYVIISSAVNDSNILFTTPQVLCILAREGFIDKRYIDMTLTYLSDIKNWNYEIVEVYRQKYLR